MSRQLSSFDPKQTSPQQAECIAAIARKLDDDERLTKLYKPKYRSMTGGIQLDIPHQVEAQKRYWASKDPLFVGQIAPGGGKTIIAGLIAKKHREMTPDGHVIYICHSGDILEQGREKYSLVMPDRIGEIGYVNQPTRERKIHFVTAQKFVGLVRSGDPVFKRIINDTVHMTIDEGHHYPKDDDDRLVIFGEVEKIARELFLARDKRVFGMTGTHYRMDRLSPLGREIPDYSFTIQDANNAMVCPNIHGIQVDIDIIPDGHEKAGDFYRFKMSPGKREAYLDAVVTNMLEIYRRIPKPFCGFTRTVRDGHEFIERFNNASGLGSRGIALLVGDTSRSERNAIREAMMAGELVGYITCNVGSEGIDIPPIEVVHIIGRTSSTVKLSQMVGRGLRVCEGKKRCLVVDYTFRKEYVISGCVGLFDYGNTTGSWLPELFERRMPKARPIVVQEHERETVRNWISSRKLSDEEVWISPVKYVTPQEFQEFAKSLELTAYSVSKGLKMNPKRLWLAYCDGELKDLPPKPDNIPRDIEKLPEYVAYFPKRPHEMPAASAHFCA